MFYNLLRFPEKYKVDKKLGKERYLKFANLTPAERKKIEAYMQNAEVLYAIPFEDGSEVVVLYTLLDYYEYNRYLMKNYIDSIAQSLPYRCLLIVRQEDTCRFYVFDTHENKNNSGRSVVDSCYASFDFNIHDSYSYDEQLLCAFRDSITKCHTDKQLFEYWRDAILFHTGPEDNYPYYPLIHRPTEINEEDRVILKPEIYNRKTATLRQLYEGSDTFLVEQIEDDPDNFKYHEDISIDYIPEYDYETAAFVDFCCNCCRTLYEEACVNCEIDENEWLIQYFFACEQYANDCNISDFSPSIIGDILNSFFDMQKLRNSSDYGNYDKDDLKEYLPEYF